VCAEFLTQQVFLPLKYRDITFWRSLSIPPTGCPTPLASRLCTSCGILWIASEKFASTHLIHRRSYIHSCGINNTRNSHTWAHQNLRNVRVRSY
jgi:hypothetical protein